MIEVYLGLDVGAHDLRSRLRKSIALACWSVREGLLDHFALSGIAVIRLDIPVFNRDILFQMIGS